MTLPDAIRFSRQAGTPLFGKRTRRAVTSVSEFTEQEAQVEAQRLGFPNLSVFYHAAIVHVVHRKSMSDIVTRESLKRKKKNCTNSQGNPEAAK